MGRAMIGLIAEWKRKRELEKYFRVRFFRERHEVYLRAIAILGMADEKPLPGVTVYSILSQNPGSVQVDMRLTARILKALHVDGLVEYAVLPPSDDLTPLGNLYARYRITRQGKRFLDQWWVRCTLQRIPGEGPDPASFARVSQP